MPYHHGDLRRTVLQAAAEVVARDGVDALSLRAVARQAGVSHTAFRHHFGDRRGVLTALAAEGYHGLADAVAAGGEQGFLEAGVAYVRYAVEQPARFQLLFRPGLVDEEDPELVAARTELAHTLMAGVAAFAPERETDLSAAPTADPLALGAWSIAHGLATLALAGVLPARDPGEVAELARGALTHLAP